MPTVLALLSVPASIGYPVLFGLVAAESAGALVPGETALIVSAALAGRGQLSLPLVIVTAAAAAILGDNVGYLIGRNGLRRLLDRPGRLAARRNRAVKRGEAFFRRHGPAAVFLGRFLPGLRVIVAWLAGAERFAWRRFLLWNSLGGIAWAASIASAAYALGRSASGYLALLGLGGIAVAAAVFAARRLRRPPALARAALRDAARAAVDVAAFLLVTIVVAVVELNELRHEAANALAPPKRH
jgi:membrane protein DedA with SNARE-associated domain